MSSRLRLVDLLRTAAVGLHTRRLRTSLTALGIAIGIAAMVAVVGISASSRANLLAELDELGTDLLRVAPGQTPFGDAATLPESARATAERIGPVTEAAGITGVPATVRRTDHVDEAVTGGIRVVAADQEVLAAVSGELADGRFLDDASERLPTVVLGAAAAERLGVTDADAGIRVWLGGEWFAVIGILEPAPLAPDLDSAAIIGYPVAEELFATTRSPSTLYVRTVAEQVEAVRAVLGRTVDPESPDEVDVSRPSDALEARAATDEALRNLLLGLGAVALVVGGVGITNVMVISVLERRGRDRCTAGARRPPRSHRRAVPDRGGVPRLPRRDRRCRHRLSGHCRVRPQPGLARRRADVGARRGRGDVARRRRARRRIAGDPGRPPRPGRGTPAELTHPSVACTAPTIPESPQVA